MAQKLYSSNQVPTSNLEFTYQGKKHAFSIPKEDREEVTGYFRECAGGKEESK